MAVGLPSRGSAFVVERGKKRDETREVEREVENPGCLCEGNVLPG